LDINVSITKGHSGPDPQNLKKFFWGTGKIGKVLVDHYSMAFRAPRNAPREAMDVRS